MDNTISCKYMGHATTFTNLCGTNILTDPVFSKRVFFFKRHTEIAANPLPVLPHVILISHTHFDHLDIGSYKFIPRKIPIIIPEGCEALITKFVSNPVIELSLFATHNFPDGTSVTAVPAIHRGGRYSQLRYTASNSYLIKKDGKTVYFCGGSAFGPHFGETGKLAQIDLALLPVGCYSPRWLMKHWHTTPTETVKAFEDLNAKHMVPIHWGTFSLSLEPPGQPIELLKKIIDERAELNGKIHIIKHGEEFVI